MHEIFLGRRIFLIHPLQHFLDILPLGKAVIGTGAFHIGDRIAALGAQDIFLMRIDERTDECRVRAAHVHLRQESGDLSAMDHVEEERLYRIIAVMAEGDLRAAQLLRGSDDARLLEFRAQRALDAAAA